MPRSCTRCDVWVTHRGCAIRSIDGEPTSYVATEDRTYYKAIKLISGPIAVGDKVRASSATKPAAAIG